MSTYEEIFHNLDKLVKERFSLQKAQEENYAKNPNFRMGIMPLKREDFCREELEGASKWAVKRFIENSPINAKPPAEKFILNNIILILDPKYWPGSVPELTMEMKVKIEAEKQIAAEEKQIAAEEFQAEVEKMKIKLKTNSQ